MAEAVAHLPRNGAPRGREPLVGGEWEIGFRGGVSDSVEERELDLLLLLQELAKLVDDIEQPRESRESLLCLWLSEVYPLSSQR